MPRWATSGSATWSPMRRCGVSAVIDSAGRVLAHTGTFERAALSHEVAYLKPARTPYEIYGDAPWWACTVAVAALCVFPRRRRG